MHLFSLFLSLASLTPLSQNHHHRLSTVVRSKIKQKVKKKVERSHESHITQIIYKDAHNHPKPPLNRRLAMGLLIHLWTYNQTSLNKLSHRFVLMVNQFGQVHKRELLLGLPIGGMTNLMGLSNIEITIRTCMYVHVV